MKNLTELENSAIAKGKIAGKNLFDVRETHKFVNEKSVKNVIEWQNRNLNAFKKNPIFQQKNELPIYEEYIFNIAKYTEVLRLLKN